MNAARYSGPALLLGIGLALGGWFIGHGFVKARSSDRFVTVKGVSEREVKADLALWPLHLNVGDNDLTRAQARVARNTSQVLDFLARHGIDTANAELQGYRVVDVHSRAYGADAGVVLSSGEEWGPGGPTFPFTRLNDLKPEMIAEATASAREAAEQFATDSRSDVGGIRRANQGVFVILPRDQAPGVAEPNQLFKTVRVVSTIEYSLKD